METLNTHGILIGVKTAFISELQDQDQPVLAFRYEITIYNHRKSPVQLLKRTWHIFNSNNTFKTVDGDGVLGKQPILAAGESYQYESWCPLETEIGSMEGFYTFADLDDDTTFHAVVPRMIFVAPFLEN